MTYEPFGERWEDEGAGPLLWDADPDVCCAAFQLGACQHTEGYCDDQHEDEDMSDTATTADADRETVFCCPKHAPMAIDAQPYDDGKPVCCVCGTSNYAVKPYLLKSSVVDRGWRYAPRSPYARPRVRA